MTVCGTNFPKNVEHTVTNLSMILDMRYIKLILENISVRRSQKWVYYHKRKMSMEKKTPDYMHQFNSLMLLS